MHHLLLVGYFFISYMIGIIADTVTYESPERMSVSGKSTHRIDARTSQFCQVGIRCDLLSELSTACSVSFCSRILVIILDIDPHNSI